MTATRLTPDLAPADLTAWRLILKVSPSALSALILGPQGPERAVIAHAEALSDSSLEVLENAIYDNPLLLSDFGQVDILIATSQRVSVPDSVPMAMDEEIVRTMLPDFEAPRRLLSAPMPGGGRLVEALDGEMLGFLRRTFPDGRFSPSLVVLAQAVEKMRPEDAPVNVAIADEGEMVIISFDADGLLTFANRFEVDCAADCAYFILAALGPDAKSLSIGGNVDLRNETLEELRRATPHFEPTPLFLGPEISNLRRRADFLPLELFFAAV